MLRLKNLHKAHARAHAVERNAVDLFKSLADDLRTAADGHAAVALTANEHIGELAELRESALEGMAAAERKAKAIEALVA